MAKSTNGPAGYFNVFLRVFFILPILLFLSNPVNADLLTFSWGGPGTGLTIRGIVDTHANTMRVENWILEDEFGITLQSLPRTYTALDASGNIYDVPDTGWTGRISDWGFIPDQIENLMSWDPPIGWSLDQIDIQVGLGWGGLVDNFPVPLFLTGWDESVWWVPTPTSGFRAYFDMDGAVFSPISSVPEPSTWAMTGTGFACMFIIFMVRKTGKFLAGMKISTVIE